MTKNKHHILAALIAFGGLAALPGSAEDRALVVGISDYSTLSGAPILQTATKDAADIADWLVRDLGYPSGSVTVLLESEATAARIMSTLIDRLIRETAPGDRILFYFAGMGTQVADGDGSVKRALLSHDADTVLGRIPEDAIADVLSLAADRDVTVIIDTAFAGNGSPRSRGISLPGVEPQRLPTFPFATAGIDRTIWTAAGPGQHIWETSEGGVFTQALLDGLRGNADSNGNGTISNAELLTYVRSVSDDWCDLNLYCATNGLGLTPNFAGAVQASPGRATSRIATGTGAVESTAREEDNTLALVSDLFIPSNEANLTLAINEGARLTVGDVVSFEVSADSAGTLILLDINPLGELAQVFPSSLAPESGTKIRPGAPVTIPQGLSSTGRALQVRVTEPSGDGFLLGLLIEDEVNDLTAILPANLSGGPVSDAGRYLFDIAQDLLALRPDGPGSAPVRWSATYLPYTIFPQSQ